MAGLCRLTSLPHPTNTFERANRRHPPATHRSQLHTQSMIRDKPTTPRKGLHPEEAARAAVSKDAMRLTRFISVSSVLSVVNLAFPPATPRRYTILGIGTILPA